MTPNEYQSLALKTESSVGTETVLRTAAAIGTLTSRFNSLYENLNQSDFDAIKRLIFYDVSGNPLEPEARADARFLHGYLGLVSELFEFMSLVRENDTIDKNHLREELGDLMWYISLIADSQSITLKEICDRNIAKLKVRYPSRFTVESAKDRDLEQEKNALA